MPNHAPANLNLAKLEPFIGSWRTRGEMKAGSSAKFSATDTYEWLPGGHFLLHRIDADMPVGKVQGIEVFGHIRGTDAYRLRSYDNSGNESVMEARVQDGTWTFLGEGVRFTGRFREEGKVFGGLWELGLEGAWKPWMEVELTKADDPAAPQ